jgi:hypothetical protein
MNTRLRRDEDMIRDGMASIQRGIETVGGNLYLTTQRLIFESHALNIQTGKTIIPLGDVKDVQTCWTKFLGLIPVFPNGLAVSTKTGETFRFVLFSRTEWMRAILKAKRRRAKEEEEEEDERDEKDDDEKDDDEKEMKKGKKRRDEQEDEDDRPPRRGSKR